MNHKKSISFKLDYYLANLYLIIKNKKYKQMKNILFFLVLIASTLFLSCSKKVYERTDVPECILKRIEKIKNEPVRNPAGSIWQYTYKGKTVYFEPAYCCDMFSYLYDSNCNVICHPDGGITGSGDRLCLDFFEERTNERLIWKDERGLK